MKKFLCILLSVLMALSVMSVPAFAASNAPAETSETGETESNFDTSSFGAFMKSVFDAIGKSFGNISVEEILKLPVSVMASVTTYIFQFMQMIGINVDSFYAMLGKIFG